ETFVSQVYEWCNNGIVPQKHNQGLQHISTAEPGYTRWIKNFDQGLPIFGRTNDFPVEEQELLREQGILSLICIAIQVEKDWWGFIGFDDCVHEREWTETEIDALRAAANTLGTAIEKKNHEEALLNSEISYRGLFNAVRDAIYVQDQDG